ncbi:MAG: M1 family metallopeptidase [Bacteroidales bacterium]
MKTKSIITIILIMSCIHAFGQNQSTELYIPRNIKQAYKNGTRSMDGKPGKNYWQNFGRYDIDITVVPKDRALEGSENITYFNSSSDTLKNLVIKLITNIHKPGAVREWTVDSSYLTTGVHIDSYTENDVTKPWKENQYTNTYQIIDLTKPIVPGDSIQISFQWHYEISRKSYREGMIDSTTCFLAYFYPRIAVYDDYQGWDESEFNDWLEFYNDFNDYKLSVKVPKNYLVWATGTLQNTNEVLMPEYASKLANSMNSDEIIHIVSKEDWTSKKITQQNPMNKWKWQVKNITDAALAISDHYNWDASSVIVDNKTKRRASVQAAYCDTAVDYRSMVRFCREDLAWFSHNWPGISYPYEKTTIFQGFAGMEYPMMVNDESYLDTIGTRWIAGHEISHTYMPFYMGINETQYGFMDEGWATTFELLINTANFGKDKAEELYKKDRVDGWAHSKRGSHDFSADTDLPIIALGNSFYGNVFNEYGKPSLGYLALKDFLGDEIFRKCLHEYMNRWHGKHPIPWDFFYSFNNASGQNLDWFWNNWFFSNNYIDIGFQDVKKSGNSYNLKIDNIGGMAVPFDVEIIYTDGSKESIHQTPAVWKVNQKNTSIKINSKKPVKSMKLEGGIFMDADEENNVWVGK